MTAAGEARNRIAARYDRHGYHRQPGNYATAPADARQAAEAVYLARWAHDYYADGGPCADRYSPAELARERDYHPVPDRDDLLDALTQIPAAREEMDRMERALIEACRTAGVEWQEIGEALGYPLRAAKQSASARLSGLKSRKRPVRVPRRSHVGKAEQ